MKILNILKNFIQSDLKKISRYDEIDGWLTQNEALGLYCVAKKIKKNGIVLEIGSWKGKSTFCIAMGLKGAKLYALDPFNAAGDPDSEEVYRKNKGNETLLDQFKNNMTRLGVFEEIIPLVGYSRDFVDSVGLIDFLFIDGDHSKKECEFDFINYSSKVKKGGFIAFHDYYSERLELGPTWVINNHVLKSDRYRFYGLYDSLWVCEVVSDILED